MRARSESIFFANLERMVKGEPLLNQVTERDIV